ncbi:MAG: hypothetical protein ISN26_07815 [Betaproteobacteria bacterium AqS2]|uniref:Uncharacterized protein n=1 Tax=Candidatus Amphirhobacter heronislandensis TaxID=1732024 RepID=A0A930UJ00_9GAMM|nr:hypothetical protein [Betaproteobacteria bacterium AqS2]
MKKVDDILKNPEIRGLRREADRHAEIGEALRAALPAWLDSGGLSFELADGGVLYLAAPTRAKQTQLKQLLPALGRVLRGAGVRRLRLGRPPAA